MTFPLDIERCLLYFLQSAISNIIYLPFLKQALMIGRKLIASLTALCIQGYIFIQCSEMGHELIVIITPGVLLL